MRRNIEKKDLERLDDEKILEGLKKTNHLVGECPDCGNFTAFFGKTGFTDGSECSYCGHTEGF